MNVAYRHSLCGDSRCADIVVSHRTEIDFGFVCFYPNRVGIFLHHNGERIGTNAADIQIQLIGAGLNVAVDADAERIAAAGADVAAAGIQGHAERSVFKSGVGFARNTGN